MAAAAYENQPTFIDRAPRLMCTAEIANAVGLIPTTDRATITVRDAAGRERAEELTLLSPGERMVTATLEGSALPLSRRPNPNRNWYEVLPEHKTLYVRYDTCADEPTRTVKALSAEMLAAIGANGLDRVIVDLRGNGGGNSGLLRPFIRGLRKLKAVNRPGGVAVLIGRRTFSSAQLNAVELKNKLGATLFGEPTGQKPNAYGEVRSFKLPVSQIAVQYSTRFWRTEPGDRPSMEPDVLVTSSSADYFAGRDPVLDAALSATPGN
jgi:C-terminal processing protease CtpA/Prc